jgi:short-subunit dehydrogenase
MKDNVVLITGASSGIGQAVARELARRGARLVLTARRIDRLEALAEELSRGPGQAIAVKCDVTRDGDPEEAVAAAVRAYGRLDTVYANAGFAIAGRFEKLTLDDHRRQLETNLFGVLRTLKAALPELKTTRGRIGVVGSVNGYIGTPATSSYCMSKFALRGLCMSLRPELKPYGISVTHIAPGFVASEIRAKDNREVVHPDARDPVPSWLVMPAEAASREIVNALARRKREQVVTFHGKVFVFLVRHAPWLVESVLHVVDADKRAYRRKEAGAPV